jgi:hypothetical protein
MFIIGGVCCILCGLLKQGVWAHNAPVQDGTRAEGEPMLVLGLALVGKMCIAAAFAVIYNYSVEVFPTVARHTGTGYASLCARFGSLSAPQIRLLVRVPTTCVTGCRVITWRSTCRS